MLQETHSGENTHTSWKQEWGNDAFWSGHSNNSEGIGILINPTVSYTIQKYTELIPGRMQALELIINDKEIYFINIYGPNNDDCNFFEQLEKYLKENDEKTFIIGGDFNTVLNENLDKRNGRIYSHKRCRTVINNIIDGYSLTDIWRDMHPDIKQFTWHSHHKPPIFCRLDYFLISENLRNSVVSCKHNIGYKSDHSKVSLNIDLINLTRGPGYFKLNNSLLLDKDYQETVKKNIAEIAEINKEANPNTKWELIKGTIRNETIKYATYNKKETNKQEKKLTNEINELQNKISESTEANVIEVLKNDLNEKKNTFEQLTETKLNGLILRSKANIVEHDEKNSKYFASLEKKRSETKLISRLCINNVISTNPKEILTEIQTFYKNLYNKREMSNSKYNFFDQSINKLSNIDQIKCEGEITESECINALKSMINQKSPGTDGITVEFYKLFWNNVKEFYVNSINYSFQTGSLTELQKQSIITIIPKQNKDLTSLDSWRPISLLNVDYKIATKVIANRVKHVITKIIHNSQTGFIKGRYIGENIRLLFEIIDNAEEENKPGLIFFTDFEKAFDSIDHTYIINCLNILTSVKILLSGYNYSIKMQRVVFPTMDICLTSFLFCEVSARGVPCPLTSSLYVLSSYHIR